MALSALLVLAACGGGGGGGGSTSVVTSPMQGVFQGTTTNGKTIDALILEDGSFWDIYGIPSGNALTVQGVAVGSSTANNGNFTLSFNDFYTPGNTAVSGTGSGTYSGTNLVGTLIENGVTGTFNLTAPVTTNYNYNVAATIATVAGSWSGSLLDGETATVNITLSGTLTGTSSLGCAVTGTVTPRPSGKNVFNVSVTFGASPCVLPNQTSTGIGLTYPLGNGTNQLIVGLVTPSQTKATAFFAIR